MEDSSNNWTPTSWKSKTAQQQPIYADPVQLADAIRRLQQLPPLLTSWEIEELKSGLADAARGEAFLLQGGDCSENLEDCETEAIVRNLKVIMQMSFVLIYGSRKRVIRVGRIAGQYAKPRSANTETKNGVTLPTYRGDMINRSGFTEKDRQPDPELMLRGYERAALTLNFIRSLIGGGFADLHHPENWDLDFVNDSPRAKQYHGMVASITDSLRFMEAVFGSSIAGARGVNYYTSHEGLHLSYESAQTRRVPRRHGWYNLSTHFPWIGNRTRAIDGAHVEYFRGIMNPIGLKISADIDSEELSDLLRILNPTNEPGRITLIHRFGHAHIQQHLPRLIDVVKQNEHNVLWSCDPMHGNTFVTDGGIKTRDFDQIINELTTAFDIHEGCGSILGGVHLELSGDNVTECIGGESKISVADLHRAYKSQVDPRLNYEQAMEIAFRIAQKMGKV
jgi:3-deoxy-7-phosphoheptulonate synthase